MKIAGLFFAHPAIWQICFTTIGSGGFYDRSLQI